MHVYAGTVLPKKRDLTMFTITLALDNDLGTAFFLFAAAPLPAHGVLSGRCATKPESDAWEYTSIWVYKPHLCLVSCVPSLNAKRTACLAQDGATRTKSDPGLYKLLLCR